MKPQIFGRMIVLGTMLVLATACNPLVSRLGVPDFLKGHSTWYAATEKDDGTPDPDPARNGILHGYWLACENAIAKAEKANPGKNVSIKKIKVTGVIDEKSGRINQLTCRIKI